MAHLLRVGRKNPIAPILVVFNGKLLQYPKGPCTQYLSIWDLGNSNYSTGLG